MACCACLWGIAGVEIAAIMAALLAVQQHICAFMLASAGGGAWPRALQHADGGTYDGEWSNGKKEGLGVYWYPSVARYEGWWRGNLKHGRGVYHYKDGGKYEGEFIDGQRSGLGVRTWTSGEAKVCTLRQPTVDLRVPSLAALPVVPQHADRAASFPYMAPRVGKGCRHHTHRQAHGRQQCAQAAYFRDGKFQRHAKLADCGALLQGCADAAAAARRVRTGRPGFSEAFSQPSFIAPVAAVFASALSYGRSLPEPVVLSIGFLASLHIPLALLGFGASLARTPVAERHVYPIRTVLGIRFISAALLATLVLIVSPQMGMYAMRSAAIAVCLFAPASPQVRSIEPLCWCMLCLLGVFAAYL